MFGIKIFPAFASRFPRLALGYRYVRVRKKRFIALVVIIAHVVGALTSVQAVMTTRTAQGATAWAIALNTFPYVAVPAYWVFGSRKFDGDVILRRGNQQKAGPLVGGLIAAAKKKSLVPQDKNDAGLILLEKLSRLPATTGNDVRLLRDGGEIFPSILEGIDDANDYILLQFYIVRADALGMKLQAGLLAAVARGVRVHFIFDEIGSYGLPDSYVKKLRDAGVQMLPFNTTKGWTNRFQLNFRNHRKVVVVDGRKAWVGGANIGDEYNNGDGEEKAYIDTMVRIEGPAVQTVQVPFWEDWLWAGGNALEIDWEPRRAESGADKTVLCVPSGPADQLETCTLYFLQLINSATSRLWLASPYFVPDEQIVNALELAALRGVEVRILVPEEGDSALVDLSGWAHVQRLGRVGVRFYRRRGGFMHQKVALVDSDRAVVGSANLDNRSFRLNFEMSVEIRDEAFAGKVAEMLEGDFAKSRLVPVTEPEKWSFFQKFKVRAANLLSPVQ